LPAFPRLIKDECAQLPAVKDTVAVEHFRSKCRHNGCQTLASRRDHLSANVIGSNNGDPKFL
jgi:hypothetical protein